MKGFRRGTAGRRGEGHGRRTVEANQEKGRGGGIGLGRLAAGCGRPGRLGRLGRRTREL